VARPNGAILANGARQLAIFTLNQHISAFEYFDHTRTRAVVAVSFVISFLLMSNGAGSSLLFDCFAEAIEARFPKAAVERHPCFKLAEWLRPQRLGAGDLLTNIECGGNPA
jgi:hypothetical protein